MVTNKWGKGHHDGTMSILHDTLVGTILVSSASDRRWMITRGGEGRCTETGKTKCVVGLYLFILNDQAGSNMCVGNMTQ